MQTLGAISESINETRHCTAASYTIRWVTGPRGVYLSTEQVSRRLAASASKPDCTSAFPTLRWAASGQRQVKEASASGGQRYTGSGREQQGGARPRTRMLTPLIDGLGRASNVVLDNASYSISNAVVLAKSLVLYSSACCTTAVGIAHKLRRCL